MMKQCFRLTIIFTFFMSGMLNASPYELRDKIAQMIIVGFDGKKINKDAPIVKIMEQENIGGVILFDYNAFTENHDKNIESPEQVRQLNLDLQQFNRNIQIKEHRPFLPLLIAVDYEGGFVNRLKSNYGFPNTISAEEVGQLDELEAKQHADRMATTLEQAEFNLNLAPVLDVNINPDSPIIGKKKRSFSNLPSKVTQYAAIFSSSYRDHNIQCAYKHFPGHGSATADTHSGFVDVTDTWKSEELEPYSLQLLPEASSCGAVMTAHTVNRQLDSTGLPATLSYTMLTGVLRNQLGFNGVIITDDMQMKAISEHYTQDQSITLAINAGADMLLFANQLSEEPQDPEDVIDLIEAKVSAGEIDKTRIEEAYQHIVALKRSMIH